MVFGLDGCRVVGPGIVVLEFTVPMQVPGQGAVRQKGSDPGDLLSVHRLGVES